LTTDGLLDGRDVAADGTKLDGIESGATADQTAAEIKTAYESNADTNAFTDADESKLDGIEASADVTDTANVTAAGALMDSELTSEASVKALNQGVATTDSPTFAGVTSPVTGNVTGNLTGNVTGDVTGDLTGDVTGNVTGNLTGSILTAAQTNITSVGNLTGLGVSGATLLEGNFTAAGQTGIALYANISNKRVGIQTGSPTVSLDIGSATDAVHVPVGTTAQRPTGAAGMFRYNSTTGGFEGYTDAWGAIAGGGGGVAPSIDTMTGDGSDTTLTLTNAPTNENATFVTIDGVAQHKSTYSVSGTTLTFSTAPPTGSAVEAITLNTTSISTASILQDADGNTKVQVEESSDEDKIRFDTAGTERMIIDSTGVGIGTSSANYTLTVKKDVDDYIAKLENDGNSTSSNGLWVDTRWNTSTNTVFKVTTNSGSTDVITAKGDGNVGIGTSDPSAVLEVRGVAPNYTLAATTFWGGTTNNDDHNGIMLSSYGNALGGSVGSNLTYTNSATPSQTNTGRSSGEIQFGNTTTSGRTSDIKFGGYVKGSTTFNQRMTLDSSGNLLVGTTDSNVYNDVTGTGTVIQSNGIMQLAANNGTPLYANRQGNDGDIIDFRKGGLPVGSIGVGSSDLLIGKADIQDCFLRFGTGGSAITLCDSGGLNSNDGLVDLGQSNYRFGDIYATNGTIQTSDRNEKQDIEELSDAEQRVAVACKGLLRKFRWIDAVEAKGDDARIHFGIIAQDLQDAFTAEGLNAGRYAMFISSTWTDEETGEERTRLGVRYSELLAFIISAI
jgi:hypothetical protein